MSEIFRLFSMSSEELDKVIESEPVESILTLGGNYEKDCQGEDCSY